MQKSSAPIIFCQPNKFKLLEKLVDMLSVIFGYCDMRTNLTLVNVDKKFRKVMESKIRIFSEFIQQIQMGLNFRPSNTNTTICDLSRNYLSNLATTLRDIGNSATQVDDFVSHFLNFLLKETKSLYLFDNDFFDDFSPIGNLRYICLALKDNAKV
jgi:hypothetical protein